MAFRNDPIYWALFLFIADIFFSNYSCVKGSRVIDSIRNQNFISNPARQCLKFSSPLFGSRSSIMRNHVQK